MDSLLLGGRVAVAPSSVVNIFPAIEVTADLGAGFLLALSPNDARNSSRDCVHKTADRGTLFQLRDTRLADFNWLTDSQRGGIVVHIRGRCF